MIAAAIALVAGAVIADALVPWAGRCARRLGCVAHANPDVPTHVDTVPLLGGLAILGGLVPAVAIAVADAPRWWALAAALVPMIALGAWKDRVERPVAPALQMIVQAGAAALLWLGGFRSGAGAAPLDLALTIALAIAVINAWNFIDIVDGLAAGVAAASAMAFALGGDRAAAVIAIGLAGASLGYLRHNWPPARIFMGDVGSFAIGTTFVALILDGAPRGRLGAGLVAMALPLADVAFTTASRVAAGKSPLAGGPEHLPLRLIARGWSGVQVNVAAYALAIATGLLAHVAA